MSREELLCKLTEKFGIVEGYKRYSQIIELLDYTFKHINECGFPFEFYEKIFEIL